MPISNRDTTNQYDEVQVAEIVNYSALQTTISVTSTPTELKVGASRLSSRKAIFLMPLENGLSWGFSNVSQPFLLFRRQFLVLPIGEDVGIWVVADTGTKEIVVAETV